MKVNFNKQHILSMLWLLAVTDIVLFITISLLTQHYPHSKNNDPLQQLVTYLSTHFSTVCLLISLFMFAAFMTAIYLLQLYDTADKSETKKLKSLINRLKFILKRKKNQKSQLLNTINDLGENRTQYFMLLDLTAAATLTINESQCIVQFNQAAERLFGYEKEAVINRPLTMLLPENNRASHHEKVKGFGKSAASFSKLREASRVRGLRKNGEIFHAELDIAKVNLVKENLFIASITDITERIVHQKKMAEKNDELEHKNITLHQYQKMLERKVNERTNELTKTEMSLSNAHQQLIDAKTMASLGEMVSSAAHEINTPIGICVTCASNLQDVAQDISSSINSNKLTKSDLTSFTTSIQQSSKIILNNMERAASLVQSFKSVSSDQMTDMQRSFNLNDYLNEIVFSLKPKLSKTTHQIYIDCDEAIILNSKPGALAQIMTNLIINSLIHGFEDKQEGTILINATRDNHMIKLQYTDNGKGLTDEQKSRLFEPFYTSKKEQGGTGLGMHIVEELVENSLKGTIALVDNEQGITLDLTFPCQVPTEEN